MEQFFVLSVSLYCFNKNNNKQHCCHLLLYSAFNYDGVYLIINSLCVQKVNVIDVSPEPSPTETVVIVVSLAEAATTEPVIVVPGSSAFAGIVVRSGQVHVPPLLPGSLFMQGGREKMPGVRC